MKRLGINPVPPRRCATGPGRLELMQTPIFEPDARTRNEILDRARNENLPRFGEGRYSCPDAHGDPPDLFIDQFALARMHAGTDLDPQVFHGTRRSVRAPDRSRGAVERSEEPVACCVDLPPPVSSQQSPDPLVVAFQQLLPAHVTELTRAFGGPHDVREEHRRPIRSRRVHDGADVVHPCLERQLVLPLHDVVGKPRAAPIEDQHPGERGQPPEERGDWCPFPGLLHVEDPPHHENQVGRTIAEHLVGDVRRRRRFSRNGSLGSLEQCRTHGEPMASQGARRAV